MLLEKFLQETGKMRISHLFFDTKQLGILEPLQKEHPQFTVYPLTEQTHVIPSSEVLFIELGQSTKEKFKTLVGIFTKHKPLVSYIFADDVEDRLLLKFALHFGITDVLPLRNDEALLHSIFTKNANKLDTTLETFKRLDIEQKMERCFAFLIFKEGSLVYANTKVKRLFGETCVHTIEKCLYEDNVISKLLSSDEDAQTNIVIETEENEKELYVCLLNNFPSSNEKMLSFLPHSIDPDHNSCSTILNRFDFVDKLKDKLAQQSISQKPISLIFLNISNLDKLNTSFTNITLYESLKRLLSKVFQLKEDAQDIAQWSPNLYILLCENCNFEESCEQTRFLHQELVHFSLEEKVSPIIISSTLSSEKHSLNDLLTYIEKINTQNLLSSDIEKLHYHEIGYLENIADTKEQINYLMRNCINNKIPIKLLNIYKGLCINTQSYVIKYSDDTYHLHCENLQGYAMQLEGETVLQAPNFPKDIKAEVTLVDIKKGFVIIKNLNFMPYSANNRQHTRVQTTIRTPILIRYAQKSSAQGEIIDISINSIAIRCNNKLMKHELLNQPVRLNFSLPSEEGENGYVIMDITAKVTYVSESEDHTKVVVMLGALKKPYDDYLLSYMYSRQKELILEIRRATKVYN
ncbi:MAG: pilus assembly protein PilZ [Sulfurospirillum sp.]|nr:pilus assembly protein PilZ [Sulfurospirillum sp.]MBP9492034.1 pilus assembly protein PilZ [Sulfurospirillum sp.]MBP9612379.1 pilus assembly protein PilZ [Sulfurospirillum sp.]